MWVDVYSNIYILLHFLKTLFTAGPFANKLLLLRLLKFTLKNVYLVFVNVCLLSSCKFSVLAPIGCLTLIPNVCPNVAMDI